MSQSLTILFRHYSLGPSPWLGKLAAKITGWEYVHVGALIGGDTHVYEAAMRHGVTRRPITEWLPHERGQIIAVDVKGCDVSAVESFLAMHVGKGYDWAAMARLPFNRGSLVTITSAIDKTIRLFCSEYLIAALRHAGCCSVNALSIAQDKILPKQLFEMLLTNNS